METYCYAPRRVVKANHNNLIIRPSEVHSTLINEIKCEVHVISEVKDYAILVVCKNSLTDFSSISNPIFVVSKCNDIISSKFKVVKFTL